MAKKDFFDEDTFISEDEDLVIQKNANIIARGIPRIEAHGKSKTLSNRAFGIGRDRHNAVIVADPNVSKFHATITFKNGKAFLRDINSSNGTFLNDKPIKPNTDVPLKNKDKIVIGKTRIIFYC